MTETTVKTRRALSEATVPKVEERTGVALSVLLKIADMITDGYQDRSLRSDAYVERFVARPDPDMKWTSEGVPRETPYISVHSVLLRRPEATLTALALKQATTRYLTSGQRDVSTVLAPANALMTVVGISNAVVVDYGHGCDVWRQYAEYCVRDRMR